MQRAGHRAAMRGQARARRALLRVERADIHAARSRYESPLRGSHNRALAPQVLLLHANVAAAQNLDALLSEDERAGVPIIPRAEP